LAEFKTRWRIGLGNYDARMLLGESLGPARQAVQMGKTEGQGDPRKRHLPGPSEVTLAAESGQALSTGRKVRSSLY
jgi:hypothetical protein